MTKQERETFLADLHVGIISIPEEGRGPLTVPIIIGFAAARLGTRELTQIFIAPDRERQGIGQRLLTWAQERMPRGFSLHTLAENHTSRAFYRRHGFVEGDTRPNPINGMRQVEYHWTPPLANKPLERPGTEPDADVGSASAGRSTPCRRASCDP